MTEFLDPDHEIMGDAAGDLIDPDLPAAGTDEAAGDVSADGNVDRDAGAAPAPLRPLNPPAADPPAAEPPSR